MIYYSELFFTLVFNKTCGGPDTITHYIRGGGGGNSCICAGLLSWVLSVRLSADC